MGTTYLFSQLIRWILQLFLSAVPVFSQDSHPFPLSDRLKEISGLELLNDSTLIAFNDGGNSSELYLLNLQGKILRVVEVKGTKNHDWEDITRDDEFVYIGDIGNNLNKRKNLAILKLKISDIISQNSVEAEKIEYRYSEQTSYPPNEDSLFYDAEAMAVCGDSIWVFTKDRSQPFQGVSYVYKIPTEPGSYTVSVLDRLKVGADGWWKDGVTAADCFDGRFYLLTYNRYIVYSHNDGGFSQETEHIFDKITQRESIVVLSRDAIFVADERNPLAGDVQMYKIRP